MKNLKKSCIGKAIIYYVVIYSTVTTCNSTTLEELKKQGVAFNIQKAELVDITSDDYFLTF